MLLSCLCFTVLSIFTKLVEQKKLEFFTYTGFLFATACVPGFVISHKHLTGLPLQVVILGAIGGVFAAGTLILFLKSLKLGGPMTVVNTLIMLSIVVPVLYSTLFLGEKLNLLRGMGLGLFVVFLALMGTSGKEDAA